jgi:hypothetical protein
VAWKLWRSDESPGPVRAVVTRAVVISGFGLLGVLGSSVFGMPFSKSFLAVAAAVAPFVLFWHVYTEAEAESQEHPAGRWVVLVVMVILSTIAAVVVAEL